MTEGSSLTSRETLTALHKCGYEIDFMSSTRLPMSAFSWWRHKVIHTVDANKAPRTYLKHIAYLLKNGGYDAILPTHEEAWLLAEGKDYLPQNAPITIATPAAFAQTQSKIGFALLLDELELPQPKWQELGRDSLPGLNYPVWLKYEYGTAGRGVRKLRSKRQIEEAISTLSQQKANRLMLQADMPGRYGQVGAVFRHGKLLAVHASLQTGVGVGGSAAARKSVHLPAAYAHIQKIGQHLCWHGPLTLDFILKDSKPYYIECNPRMVEPANAYMSGVNFPDLLIRLSSGRSRAFREVQIGASGVKTHSMEALLLGIAETAGKRMDILHTVRVYIRDKGSTEVLTPITKDLPSAIPLLAVFASLILRPKSGSRLAGKAVQTYSILPQTITSLKR